MELLIDLPVPPRTARARRFIGARRLALTTSIVVHSAMALGLATLSSKASTPPRDETVVIDVVTDAAQEPPVPLPELEPAPARGEPTVAPVVRPSRPATHTKSTRPVASAPAQPAPPEPVPREDAPPEPSLASPATAEAPEVAQKPEAAPVLAAVAPGAVGASRGHGPFGHPGGSELGVGMGRGTGSGAASGVNRQALTDGYLKELFRSRIRMHYPEAARELELSGTVTVEVTVARNGRLVRAQLTRRCPHAILCEDALATIRAAAPFPPLPAELGDAARIEVPLAYAIE
jgi:protein TonB